MPSSGQRCKQTNFETALTTTSCLPICKAKDLYCLSHRSPGYLPLELQLIILWLRPRSLRLLKIARKVAPKVQIVTAQEYLLCRRSWDEKVRAQPEAVGLMLRSKFPCSVLVHLKKLRMRLSFVLTRASFITECLPRGWWASQQSFIIS